jgi:small subunit ribosomal protein S11
MAKRRPTRRSKVSISQGLVHIQSTFNNTIVTVTDEAGNTLAWSSAGGQGFKGSRQSTPYAAQLVAKEAVEKAKSIYGLQSVGVFLKGPGSGRESALRAVAACDLRITHIRDVTSIPHNGCRPPKRRRV